MYAVGRTIFETLWHNDAEALRTEAAQRNENDWLQHWWCTHFKRPRKDPLLLEYTIEELAIEFFQHRIDEDPAEAYPTITDGDNVQFSTHDPVLNELERQIQDGGHIDAKTIFDTFPEEDRAQLTKKFGFGDMEPPADFEEEFNDHYGADDGTEGE